MENIFKQIKQIVGKDNIFKVNFFDSSIVFDIWEVEVIVVLDKDGVYIDCETMDNKISRKMLIDLIKIMEIIEGNKHNLLDIIKGGIGCIE